MLIVFPNEHGEKLTVPPVYNYNVFIQDYSVA